MIEYFYDGSYKSNSFLYIKENGVLYFHRETKKLCDFNSYLKPLNLEKLMEISEKGYVPKKIIREALIWLIEK